MINNKKSKIMKKNYNMIASNKTATHLPLVTWGLASLRNDTKSINTPSINTTQNKT